MDLEKLALHLTLGATQVVWAKWTQQNELGTGVCPELDRSAEGPCQECSPHILPPGCDQWAVGLWKLLARILRSR